MLHEDPATTGTLAPGRFRPVSDTRPDDVVWSTMAWPPAQDVALVGSAVELSQVNPGRDAAELFAALDHDVVWRHMPGRPRTAIDYGVRLAEQRAGGRLPWLVRLARPLAGLPAGTVVGTTSYLEVSAADARLEIGSTAYTPSVWATAVNPDAKFLMLSHAFEVLGAGRVQLKTDVRNSRSQQAIARLGARYDGTLRRYQRRADGTVRDTVVFSIIAEEWPSIRERLLLRVVG